VAYSSSVQVLGGREVMADLTATSAEVAAGIALATSAKGRELQRQVRFNASTGVHGPREPHIPGTGPGPNIVTGTYVGSIELEETTVGGVTVATVYTEEVRAQRLEYGFVGEDSIGRHYHQPPFPHWEPAADKVEEEFFRQVEAIVAKAAIR
jgi:hypothetical protein